MNPSPSLSQWLVFGTETEPMRPIRLRAGPLRLLFEPSNGFIRRICLGDREVIRGVYAAVRDRDWGTIPPRLNHTRRDIGSDSFHLEFESDHRQGPIDFSWRGSIRGQPDGTIEYEFNGTARSTFLRSRIGFCVLHPIRECAGAPARQTRVDGTILEGRFPRDVEPQIFGHSPFRDLRALAHEISSGLWADLRFEGDVFEMEDQRNWSDASFKTYCTPLALPFPVEVRAGTPVRQKVTLHMLGSLPEPNPVEIGVTEPNLVTVSFREAHQASRLQIGLGMATHRAPLSVNECARLRSVKPAHLRVDIRLSDPAWPALWERAVRDSEQLHAGIELAVHLPRERQKLSPDLQARLVENGARLVRVLALREGEPSTTLDTLREMRRVTAGLNVPIGAGSDANFCELNREHALRRLALAEADFVFWAMNPQVHAFDNLSIVETLEAHRDIVETARKFAGSKPLVVSTVNLRPRFNAVATSEPAALQPGELPPTVDARQSSLFGAAWTLGSLAALSAAGVESVTLYETTGWRGVVERDGGSPWPENMPSLPSAVFPVYYVLAELADASLWAVPSAPDLGRVAALVLSDGGGQGRVLTANLQADQQRVRLIIPSSTAEVLVINGDTVLAATRGPEHLPKPDRLSAGNGQVEFALAPYALARAVW